MSIDNDAFLGDACGGPIDLDGDAPTHDRRRAFRVSLPNLAATFESPIRLVDVSLSGIGFLARREDASLLIGARLHIHLNGAITLRAEVRRVDIETPSESWVRGGARFQDLGDEERAALSTLVTTRRL